MGETVIISFYSQTNCLKSNGMGTSALKALEPPCCHMTCSVSLPFSAKYVVCYRGFAGDVIGLLQLITDSHNMIEFLLAEYFYLSIKMTLIYNFVGYNMCIENQN